MDSATRREADDVDAIRTVVHRRLRGTVVDVAPVFGFTVGFALTHRLVVPLAVAAVAGAGVCLYRLIRAEPVRSPLAALALICAGGVLAARTGQGTNFFLPSLLAHCVMAVATPVLLVLGWPPMGMVVGLITGERTGWRRCPVRRRAFTRGNLVILAGHLVMLAVQLPLFLSGHAVALGSADVLGPVVLALGALLGWRVYLRDVGPHRCHTTAPTATETPQRTEMSPCFERTAS